jgi:polyhydroxybutyrate depolymerase
MKRSSIIWWLIAVWWLSGCSDSSSNAPLKASTESGEVTVMSAGVERTYYLIIPDDYDPRFFEEPLLFAYHGTTGTYDLWLNGFYDLLEAVGDDAIVVLTQALPDINGVTRWNYDYDFEYFEDVLADVESRVNFDPRRVFVTGHSNGAGMAHELGCNYGDLIRGHCGPRGHHAQHTMCRLGGGVADPWRKRRAGPVGHWRGRASVLGSLQRV